MDVELVVISLQATHRIQCKTEIIEAIGSVSTSSSVMDLPGFGEEEIAFFDRIGEIVDGEPALALIHIAQLKVIMIVWANMPRLTTHGAKIGQALKDQSEGEVDAELLLPPVNA